MTMRRGSFGLSKSIVGMGLIGLGLFIFVGTVTDVAARLSGSMGVGSDATQTFGELTFVGLAASQAFQCYLFDRVGFARGAFKILISLWPVSLVIVGTFLAGKASRAESRNFRKRMPDPSI
jgi:hypothetical protein